MGGGDLQECWHKAHFCMLVLRFCVVTTMDFPALIRAGHFLEIPRKDKVNRKDSCGLRYPFREEFLFRRRRGLPKRPFLPASAEGHDGAGGSLNNYVTFPLRFCSLFLLSQGNLRRRRCISYAYCCPHFGIAISREFVFFLYFFTEYDLSTTDEYDWGLFPSRVVLNLVERSLR